MGRINMGLSCGINEMDLKFKSYNEYVLVGFIIPDCEFIDCNTFIKFLSLLLDAPGFSKIDTWYNLILFFYIHPSINQAVNTL